MTCPRCGAPTKPGAAFCPNCGGTLNAPVQQPLPSSPVAPPMAQGKKKPNAALIIVVIVVVVVLLIAAVALAGGGNTNANNSGSANTDNDRS